MDHIKGFGIHQLWIYCFSLMNCENLSKNQNWSFVHFFKQEVDVMAQHFGNKLF